MLAAGSLVPAILRADDNCVDVIDMHAGRSADISTIAKSGVIAVIHKDTEGGDFHDKLYHAHKEEAKQHALLWASFGAPTRPRVRIRA